MCAQCASAWVCFSRIIGFLSLLCVCVGVGVTGSEAKAQCAFSEPCSGTTYYWCADADGAWNVSSNWRTASNCSGGDPGTFPGNANSDCAVIDDRNTTAQRTVSYPGSTDRVNKLLVGSASATSGVLSFGTIGGVLQVRPQGIRSGETLICSGGTLSMSAGTTNTRMAVQGTLQIDGTLTQTAALIRMNGNPTTTTTSETWFNVDIANGGLVGSWILAASTAQTITNTFTMGLGTCNDTLTINANATMTTNDWQICNTAVINATSGGATIELNGTSVTFPDNTGAAVGSRTYDELHISAGTTTLNANIVVNSELRIDDGATLDLAGFDVSLLGDLVLNESGALVPGGGTLSFDGSGNQTLRGTSPTGDKDLGTVSIAATSTVDNDLPSVVASGTLTNNGVLLAGTGTLAIDSNLTTGGTFTPEASTVLWRTTTTVASTTFNNLTIDADCSTPAGGMTVSGDLDINATRTLTAGGTINIGGGWDNAGTFVEGANTVVCNSANCSIDSDEVFANLTISGSNTLGLGFNTSVEVTSTLELNTGTFNAGNGTTLILNTVNNLATATFDAQTSTVELRGNTVFTETYHNLVVNPSGGSADLQNGTVNVDNNLTISSTRTLNCGTGDTLQVAADFTTDGSFSSSGTCNVVFDGAKDGSSNRRHQYSRHGHFQERFKQYAHPRR